MIGYCRLQSMAAKRENMYFAYFENSISYQIIPINNQDYYKGLQEDYPQGEFFDTFTEAKIWLLNQCSNAMQDYKLAMYLIRKMKKHGL